jgi:hypothetical protein
MVNQWIKEKKNLMANATDIKTIKRDETKREIKILPHVYFDGSNRVKNIDRIFEGIEYVDFTYGKQRQAIVYLAELDAVSNFYDTLYYGEMLLVDTVFSDNPSVRHIEFEKTSKTSMKIPTRPHYTIRQEDENHCD